MATVALIKVAGVTAKPWQLGLLLASILFLGACGEDRAMYSHPVVSFSDDWPQAGWEGGCEVPVEGRVEVVEPPDHVIGNGTPESCTGEAIQQALDVGGTIVFHCGANPVTIVVDRPLQIKNNANARVVIDGGGLITLSGGGKNRILYMNTCDESLVWTTPHCQDQDHPQLTVQNITFADGNSREEMENDGGGAIWARGGRFKAVNARFFNNHSAYSGPDVGGGALRVFSQSQGLPVHLSHCTFGGADSLANVASNGGAISSIGVSWTIVNSLFSYNRAIGNGGNPSRSGTPGGGSGGAIYNDGNTMTLSLCGVRITQNEVNDFGAAIFFVTNDHSGDLRIEKSHISENIGGSWHILPGISMHDDTRRSIVESIITD